MAEVHRLAGERGVPVHLDGARIFNAAVALGIEAHEIASHAESVSFCVSKGLSAPVGSIIAGSRDFIERARGFRRLLGGTMRQAGLLAACAIVAIERMVARLKDDHETARALAHGLHKIDTSLTDPHAVETNIVVVNLPAREDSAGRWINALHERGVLTASPGPNVLRLVTHRHIGRMDVEHAIAAFAAIHADQRRASHAA